jgi:twitching motility protein PilT
MRKIDLDAILTGMIESYAGVSDLLFIVDRPLQVESFGELKTVELANLDIQKLTPYQVEQVVLTMIGEDRRLLLDLLSSGSCDCSYALNEQLRFRVNIFRQKGQFGIVMRKPQWEIPSLRSLVLPPIFQDIAKEKTGLVLVTGATGSGKTTTLAAILNEINEKLPVHVVTLEDPIEFVHPHKRATFSQRELGLDFDDYAGGLRAALRQAPKVILVGEMRDRRTIEIALTAAETGHLVLSTLHTVDAGQTINRIVGMFDRNEEAQLRQRLAESLRYVVSQRLAPKRTGGRVLLLELMASNLRVRETVAFGETESRTFYEIIDSSVAFGWMTFDRSIAHAFEADMITEETAYLYATHKGRITRMLDDVKKRRGIKGDEGSGLRLDLPNQPAPPPVPAAKTP